MELSYYPVVEPKEGMRQMVDYWHAKQEEEIPLPHPFFFFMIPIGMVSLFIVAFVPRPYLPWPLQLCQQFGLLLFFSREILQLVWWFALGIHIFEAIVAFFIALNCDSRNSKTWSFLTLIYGFASLRFLLKRFAKRLKQT